MPEIDRLNEPSQRFELGFVERERTPEPLMRLSIYLHAAGLSISDTVSVLDRFGVELTRSTVHHWMKRDDLDPEAGRVPDRVAIDESVVWLTDERYWLYAAVDQVLNEFLHVRLCPACNEGIARRFVRELLERHNLDKTLFLVDGAPWLHGGCSLSAVTLGTKPTADAAPPNVYSKR